MPIEPPVENHGMDLCYTHNRCDCANADEGVVVPSQYLAHGLPMVILMTMIKERTQNLKTEVEIITIEDSPMCTMTKSTPRLTPRPAARAGASRVKKHRRNNIFWFSSRLQNHCAHPVFCCSRKSSNFEEHSEVENFDIPHVSFCFH